MVSLRENKGINPYLSTPIDANPSSTINCSGGTVDLQAYARINETTAYEVEQIPYNPPAYNSFLGSDTPVQINIDDQWATRETDLSNFDFCYYGISIDEALMGPNGMIALTNGTFPVDTIESTPTPGTFCDWEYEQNLPYAHDFNNAIYDYTIYGVYQDLDPSASTTDRTFYRIESGAGPNSCRRFIFAWVDMPMFSDNNRLYTGAIVLYEFTNIIEVYIEEKYIENNNVSPWNDGNGIVGIQGSSTEGVMAPCRGINPNWETRREAWRFVPDGNVMTPNEIDWYTGGSSGNLELNNSNTYTATTANTYTAVAEFTSCNGNTFLIEDDIDVVPTGKTWNGSVSNDWYTAANWTPTGVPTSLDCVLIPNIDTASTSDSDPIIIGGPPIPPPAAECLNLTVLDNGFLNLNSQANLNVIEFVNVNIGGKMVLRSNASLVQNQSATLNTNVGDIKVQRTVTGTGPLNYVYWSTPVESFDVLDISPGSASNSIWYWQPTVGGNGSGNHGNWNNNWTVNSNIMSNGEGFIVRDITGVTIEAPQLADTAEFIGRANNGNVAIPIFHGNYDASGDPGYVSPFSPIAAFNNDDNWNLVGNPYPSAISANDFIVTNATNISGDGTVPNILGAIWVWPHAGVPDNGNIDSFYDDFESNYGDDYIKHNLTGTSPPPSQPDFFIASGQAFFVLANHAADPNGGDSVIFNNTMRDATYDNNNFLRTDNNELERHRIWLDIVDSNQNSKTILVGYVEGATNEVDNIYDAPEFSGGSTGISLYSLIATDRFSIQGRSLPFLDTDTVSIGLRAPSSGDYSLAINTVDGIFEGENGQNIFLEDTYLDIIHDLRTSPYAFEIEEGTYNDRFILRYTNDALSVTQFENISDLTIYIKDGLVKIESKINLIESVIVYNAIGQTLTKIDDINNLSHTLHSLQPSTGVLFVKVKLSDGREKIQKIIY